MTEHEFAEIVYRALLMIAHGLEKRYGFGANKRQQAPAGQGMTIKQ
jgi:hypothetical protein